MDYEAKKVLVVGMARSGIAAAQLLRACGADVTVNDSKSEEELGSQLSPLEGLQLTRKFGCGAMELLDGMDCLVISPGIPDTAPFVVKAKEMGIYVIGELELAAQLSRGTLTAVSGTNGKTTTVSLLGEIFANSGKVTHVVGNIGYPFSLAALVSRKEDVIVCEVSSFQMETADTFHPHVALLTNITEDHLNRHGTMEVYTALKMRMFRNQTAEDFAVFNADDPGLNGLSKQVKSRVLKFSRKKEVREGAYVRDDTVYLRLDGSEKKICRTDEIYIPGPHNLENALAYVEDFPRRRTPDRTGAGTGRHHLYQRQQGNQRGFHDQGRADDDGSDCDHSGRIRQAYFFRPAGKRDRKQPEYPPRRTDRRNSAADPQCAGAGRVQKHGVCRQPRTGCRAGKESGRRRLECAAQPGMRKL